MEIWSSKNLKLATATEIANVCTAIQCGQKKQGIVKYWLWEVKKGRKDSPRQWFLIIFVHQNYMGNLLNIQGNDQQCP